MKSQSYRRQSAPSMVITKALTRSKTLSRYCEIHLEIYDQSYEEHEYVILKLSSRFTNPIQFS